ncbi:MAG TPA: DUF885 domain-containing protein [Azospirillaceae bacterium]|nr:DUF885 domain-containing protein [Azospirillaceae bacterium]
MTALRRALLTGTALLLLAVPASAQQPAAQATATASAATTAAAADDARLDAFFAESFKRTLERDPQLRSTLGMPGANDRWTVRDEAFMAETVRIATEELERLRRDFDPAKLSERARVSRRLYEIQLQEQIDLYAWRHHEYALSQLTGVHTDAPTFLMNVHTVKTVKDAEDYVARLASMPAVIDAAAANLRLRAGKGLYPQAFNFPKIAEVSRGIVTGRPFDGAGADSPLFADFKAKLAKLEAPAADKARLEKAAAAALADRVGPAYTRLIATIDAVARVATRNDGVWAMPDGDAFYRAKVRELTTTDMDPESIHQLGLRETARIHEELRGIMRQVGFQGDLKAFFAFLRTDPRFAVEDSAAGRAAYLAQATKYIDEMRPKLDRLFITKPKAPIEVRAVEPFREESAAGAFYEQPTPDGSRPAAYYINMKDVSSVRTYDLESLSYHEGIPGHHMQIAIALELEGLPDFRRFAWYNAHGEGWALYTEKLAKEVGAFQDPYSDAGRLTSELWRAARLVTDTGVHFKRWTREEATKWLVENTSVTEAGAARAIDRYLVWPAQALSYKIGMIRIEELRAKAEKELGERFDIRAFHDVVLRNGSVPLPVLEELVDAYIRSAKAV